MSTNDIYIQRDNFTYIRVEPTEVARAIESIKLMISLAEEKISELVLSLRAIQKESEDEENGIDEINDVEMAVDDLKVYLERLINIPSKPRSA